VEDRYVAIDMGGTQLRLALADRDLNLCSVVKESTDHSRGPESIVDQVQRMLEEALQESGTEGKALQRGVVASPGPLDTQTGIVHGAPNMPGWEGEVHLRSMLEDRLQIPIQPVNDANVAAVGEFRRGAGRGTRNLVYLTVSTGIGGGVIVEGRLLEGSKGMAGEIGHMTIDMHGPTCNCGNIGCLEVLASGTNIGRRFREALAAGGTSAVTEWLDGRGATAADVARGAAEGDHLASTVWSDCMEALGFGVVNCIHIFNPDMVVLGGGVTNAGDLVFLPVLSVVDRYAMVLPREGVGIVRAELRDNAGLYGAASLAIEAMETL
jgi:glucokinase